MRLYQISESTMNGPYYHVTERRFAPAIIKNGFKGGWGDMGFGVYFFGDLLVLDD